MHFEYSMLLKRGCGLRHMHNIIVRLETGRSCSHRCVRVYIYIYAVVLQCSYPMGEGKFISCSSTAYALNINV